MSDSTTPSTDVTLTLEDGSTIQVAPLLAAQVRGIDGDGDLLIREGCAPAEHQADDDYLTPLTPCCDAVATGSCGGTACKSCFDLVDPKYGGRGRLAVRVATTNTVIMDGDIAHLTALAVSVSDGGPQTINLSGANRDNGRSLCAQARAAMVRLGYKVYRNFEVHLDPPQSRLPSAAAVATAVLAVVKGIHPQRLANTAVLGDLWWDGELRPTHGVLHAVQAARARGISRVIVPWPCRAEAGLVDDVEVLGAHSLAEIATWLQGNDTTVLETSSPFARATGG